MLLTLETPIKPDHVGLHFALAALGLVPAALSKAIGAETQRPIAVVIVGGTISAALLTLIVLPVMYRLVMNLKLRLRRSDELAERAEAAEALAEALATESDHR